METKTLSKTVRPAAAIRPIQGGLVSCFSDSKGDWE